MIDVLTKPGAKTSLSRNNNHGNASSRTMTYIRIHCRSVVRWIREFWRFNKDRQWKTSSSPFRVLFNYQLQTLQHRATTWHTLFRSFSLVAGAKDFVGLEEVTKVEFLVMLFAETLGTFLLVLIGCASCITWTVENPPTVVHIAFTFGLAVASLAHVSHLTDA